jgi:hypothetical protein
MTGASSEESIANFAGTPDLCCAKADPVMSTNAAKTTVSRTILIGLSFLPANPAGNLP